MRTHSCRPGLRDTQVLDFCKKGYMVLEGVVPDEVNRRTVEFLDKYPSHEPTEILLEDWFVDSVILNEQAAGAVPLPIGPKLWAADNNEQPPRQLPLAGPGLASGWQFQTWPGAQLPAGLLLSRGLCARSWPTELLPGSHFLFSLSKQMGHYGGIRGAYRAAAPAGTIVLTVYSIWHRRSTASGNGLRNLLKYNYWRTESPHRDWIREPDFDIATANYKLEDPTFREQFRDCNDAAEMYFWLLGQSESFALAGGQGWPLNRNVGKYMESPYGVPETH